jgi:hypothetical protein
MRDENMVNLTQFLQTEFTNTRSGIDQNIVINQKRRRVKITAYSATTPQYLKPHACSPQKTTGSAGY